MNWRKLALLLVAGIAAVACFVPAGASATVLCKTTATPCGTSNHYQPGTDIEAELKPGTAITLQTELSELKPTITCKSGGLIYRTESTGSAFSPVNGATLTWTNTECTWAGNKAAHLILAFMGQFELHHISGTENAKIRVKGVEFWFSYTGGFGEASWCKIKTPAEGVDFGTLVGGASPTIVVNASFPTSFGCGITVKLSAEYNVTTPKPIYVEPS